MTFSKSENKVAVVTGSNKGIGYATVKLLCKKFNGTVFLTSRNFTKGKEAIINLNKEDLHPAYHQLDVDDKHSIQSFADYIKGNYGGINILINNAGIAFKNEANETFYEQASATLRTNYFSLVSVCAILFPLLRPGARVVNLSSSLGHLSCIHAEHLRKALSNPELTIPKLSAYMNEFVETAKSGDWKMFGWPSNAYSVSKVGVSALTRIQQKQMDNDIVVNAVHPGYCHTDMTSFRGHFPPDRGAEAVVHCALLPPNTRLRGAYMWHDKRNVSWLIEKGLATSYSRDSRYNRV